MKTLALLLALGTAAPAAAQALLPLPEAPVVVVSITSVMPHFFNCKVTPEIPFSPAS